MNGSSSAISTLTLPSEREIVMTRVFNAPRHLVFKAYTDPKLIPRWWGPRKYTTVVDQLDLRVGGVWRFVQHDDAGHEFGFHGEFREIVPPERLVQTFEFEPLPGHVVQDTIVFEDVGSQTRVTVTSLFASQEDRDGMLQSGMEAGATESNERLAELLQELSQGR
jgi:uncharacterized protein YndB with AHSA1/START domain